MKVSYRILPGNDYLSEVIGFQPLAVCRVHWRQPHWGYRGHIPTNILVGGDVNGNIPTNIITYFRI